MKLDSVVFYSKDIQAIIEFYTDKIGLQLEYRQGDKYASFLFDNNMRLGIKRASEDREIPGAQTFFFAVKDAKAEYEKATEKKLSIRKELTEVSWGIVFSILDPDGNKIEYLQRK